MLLQRSLLQHLPRRHLSPCLLRQHRLLVRRWTELLRLHHPSVCP
ncbi:hypothetical protein [Pyxidicoccus parkwayensis]|nr:hypothetical protein [Pyxidicoccus parkwaysis]